MDRLMEGRTVFVIAHRLSTVRNSNAIIVLEHGGIVERGSHDELLAQKGEYSSCTTACLNLHKIPAKKSSHPCGRINIMMFKQYRPWKGDYPCRR